MNLRPSTTHHRDLTSRLPALNHRLTRDERRFEPLAGERFSDDAHMPPGEGLFLLFIAAVVFWAGIIGFFLR